MEETKRWGREKRMKNKLHMEMSYKRISATVIQNLKKKNRALSLAITL